MKFSSIIALTGSITISFTACTKKTDVFAIAPTHIGALKQTSTISEIETIFAKDSIVKNISGDEFTGNSNEINIYDKQGNHLLILEATEEFDSTATISSIRVMDPRYKTEKGLTIASTFKDIKNNYTISKITNTLSTAIINIDELNAFAVINKKELPSELLFDTNSVIEASQIPDKAKIKYFWLDWK